MNATECPLCQKTLTTEPTADKTKIECSACRCRVWLHEREGKPPLTAACVDAAWISRRVQSGDKSIGAQIGAVLAHTDLLLIQFENVDSVSSAAVGVLVNVLKQSKLTSKAFALVIPQSKHVVHELFRITRLGILFDIFESEEDALSGQGRSNAGS